MILNPTLKQEIIVDSLPPDRFCWWPPARNLALPSAQGRRTPGWRRKGWPPLLDRGTQSGLCNNDTPNFIENPAEKLFAGKACNTHSFDSMCVQLAQLVCAAHSIVSSTTYRDGAIWAAHKHKLCICVCLTSCVLENAGWEYTLPLTFHKQAAIKAVFMPPPLFPFCVASFNPSITISCCEQVTSLTKNLNRPIIGDW